MVRSRVAHGVLRSVDAEAALAMPEVRAVITAADLAAAGIGTMPAGAAKHRDGSPTPRPAHPPLAQGRVRYLGEPIAMVVADTAKAATRPHDIKACRIMVPSLRPKDFCFFYCCRQRAVSRRHAIVEARNGNVQSTRTVCGCGKSKTAARRPPFRLSE